MRQVTCVNTGPPEDLEIREVEAPAPGAGQARVDVKAAGVNFVDALFVRGGYQIKPPTPFVPGSEVAGVVSAVGDGVSEVAVGDRVMASCGLGGYAEQVVVGAGGLQKLPDAVSFGVGATIVQSYATAVFSLQHRTQVAPGEWMLVLGAGGGVGRACVDLGRSLGANVIGVASSDEKRASAVDAGAVATIDPGAEDVKTRARELSDGGIDVVIDPVGGDLAEPALRALKWGGRYLVIGFVAGIPRLPLNQILLNNRTVIGVDWGAWGMRNADANGAIVRDIFAKVASGELRPAEPGTYPLDRAADALNDLEQRRTNGKVVLVP